MLIQHHVSPFMKDADGKTVYDLAKETDGQDYASSLVIKDDPIP